MVRRNFHHESSRLVFQRGSLQNEARENRHQNTDQIQREDQVLSSERPESRRKQHVYRKTSAAAHERSHHHGRNTVGFFLHGAGGHNRRNAAAEAHDQRNEGFAGKSQETHHAVHHESGTGHVAGVFQEGEREEQTGDHGNKGRDCLNTAADAVSENRLEPFGTADARQKITEALNEDGSEKNIEEIDKGRSDVDREDEHQIHDEQEDRNTEPAVQNDLVNFIGRALVDLAFADHGCGCCLRYKAVANVSHRDIEVAVVLLINFRNDLIDFGQVHPFQVVAHTGVAFQQLLGRPFGAFHFLSRQKLGNFSSGRLYVIGKDDRVLRDTKVIELGVDRGTQFF